MQPLPSKTITLLAGVLAVGQPALPATHQVAPEPHDVLDLLAHPQCIAPGVAYQIPGQSGTFTIKDSSNGPLDAAHQWRTSLELAKRAQIEIPPQVQRKEWTINSIRVTGQASTYGYGDGLYGKRTSSGKKAVKGVAALEIDLAHELSDRGAVPFSMAGMKAVVEFPGGQKVTKQLVDKGGLYNPLDQADWGARIEQAPVNESGVADLGTVAYRIIDLVAPMNHYPKVTVTVTLQQPLSLSSELPPAEALQRLSRWALEQGGEPASCRPEPAASGSGP
ncbi:hypothetical protein DYH09_26405 [bacterium CPR1]|nr:hypothetical protein [bacterium CPR1]